MWERQKDVLLAIDPDSDGAADELGWFDGVEGAAALPRVSFAKRLAVTRPPSILAVHLQRRCSGPASRTDKTSCHVRFPEVLDPSVACASNAVPGKYVLACVLEHMGGGADNGHYVAYRRTLDEKGWVFISDDRVVPVDFSAVGRSQAYMLFYESVTGMH